MKCSRCRTLDADRHITRRRGLVEPMCARCAARVPKFPCHPLAGQRPRTTNTWSPGPSRALDRHSRFLARSLPAREMDALSCALCNDVLPQHDLRNGICGPCAQHDLSVAETLEVQAAAALARAAADQLAALSAARRVDAVLRAAERRRRAPGVVSDRFDDSVAVIRETAETLGRDGNMAARRFRQILLTAATRRGRGGN